MNNLRSFYGGFAFENHHHFEEEYDSESPSQTNTISPSVSLSSFRDSENANGPNISRSEKDSFRNQGGEEFPSEKLATSDESGDESSRAHLSKRKARRLERRREDSTFPKSVFWYYTSRGLRDLQAQRYESLTKGWFFWDCNRGNMNHTGRDPKTSQRIRNLAEAAKIVEKYRASEAKPYRTYFLLEHSIRPSFEENKKSGVLSWNSRAKDLNASMLDKIWDTTMMYLLVKADYSSSTDICNILGALMDRRSDRVFIDLWVDARKDNRLVHEIRKQWAAEIGVSPSSFKFDSMEEYMQEERVAQYKLPRSSVYSRPGTKKHIQKEDLKFPVYRGRRNPGEQSPEP